jgi:hypothetical protein
MATTKILAVKAGTTIYQSCLPYFVPVKLNKLAFLQTNMKLKCLEQSTFPSIYGLTA